MIETSELSSDKFRLSCSLYELVEIWSMRGNEVDIVYLDDHKQEQSRTGIITNVFSRQGQEQLEVDKSLIIITKNLISINEVSFSNYLK